ncbi:MAG TPA: hypothetical protein PK453_09435 [Leptospiraceae bacterium]|nr:hypothetical protein [Leptospiraceae bacterium]HMY67140.1 hypothetical protein [Leptospiraceae bacterium]HNF13880.1 hypothetical protein [Leptospiraceae bacterium]HNF26181.1 hypothetical protein [Leptospiraceae bacterium]HNI25543.1 hypothetical protein [Leptospiraceae bacterium]
MSRGFGRQKRKIFGRIQETDCTDTCGKMEKSLSAEMGESEAEGD